jgi:hypothetical protein
MKQITTDKNLVAFCGLYCGACKKYLAEKCPGCTGNEKASWCQIRKCNLENKLGSCAECREFSDPMECKKYNNCISKIFGLIFRSNRQACIARIKEIGLEKFAQEMAEKKQHSLKR